MQAGRWGRRGEEEKPGGGGEEAQDGDQAEDQAGGGRQEEGDFSAKYTLVNAIRLRTVEGERGRTRPA